MLNTQLSSLRRELKKAFPGIRFNISEQWDGSSFSGVAIRTQDIRFQKLVLDEFADSDDDYPLEIDFYYVNTENIAINTVKEIIANIAPHGGKFFYSFTVVNPK